MVEHPLQILASPYVYTGDNPINRIDRDGNCWPCIVEPLVLTGEVLGSSEIIAAGVGITGTALLMNGINNYSKNTTYSDQDNISSPRVIVQTVSDTNKPSREHILDVTKDKGSIY